MSRSSVEAGLMDMLNRMQTCRFKVFPNLNDWFAGFGSITSRMGKLVKERDDLMAATRYGVMMLRYAVCPPDYKPLMDTRRNYDWRAG